MFSVQCALYSIFCPLQSAFFRATTIPDAQVTLNRFMTLGVIIHILLLHLYADLGNRRDRAFRGFVTGVLGFFAVLNLWVPLRGTVLALRVMPLPWAFVYLPGKDRALATKVVEALLAQDYVSGLFVDSAIGAIPGTLPMSAINMQGAARTPRPSIVINFRSYATGCDQPVLCTAEVADTGLQQGQGMHGSFSRADTMNFMAAIGPSFKSGFVNDAPVSNADMGKTLAHILALKIPFKGLLQGRVMDEAFPGGAAPAVETWTERAKPGAGGLATVLVSQRVGSTRYFDAAGFDGRTVGLDERKKAASR